MMKKIFALASVVGLTGLVSAVASAGCSSSSDPDNGPTEAGAGDVKVKEAGGSSSSSSGDVISDPPSCKDAAATFTKTSANPPTEQQATACSDAAIDALAAACLADPASSKDTKCKDARAVTANKTCAECVFGTKADATWKVINIEEGKSAQFNQGGCIDHVTGITGCGSAYIQIIRCVNTYCGSCGDQAASTACFNEVKGAECKAYLLGNDVSADDQACSNALQAKQTQIESSCFAADNTAAAETTFFKNMVKTSCQTAPSGGSGDAG